MGGREGRREKGNRNREKDGMRERQVLKKQINTTNTYSR